MTTVFSILRPLVLLLVLAGFTPVALAQTVSIPDPGFEAAIRGVGKAAVLIDLTKHQGAHPRMGAADVVPFIPIEGVTLEDCVAISRRVGEEIWKRFRIPVYLYEAAATAPERQNLENIRRGQFEGLRDEIATNPARRPDFGEAQVHPTAGAVGEGEPRSLCRVDYRERSHDIGRVAAPTAHPYGFGEQPDRLVIPDRGGRPAAGPRHLADRKKFT